MYIHEPHEAPRPHAAYHWPQIFILSAAPEGSSEREEFAQMSIKKPELVGLFYEIQEPGAVFTAREFR